MHQLSYLGGPTNRRLDVLIIFHGANLGARFNPNLGSRAIGGVLGWPMAGRGTQLGAGDEVETMKMENDGNKM